MHVHAAPPVRDAAGVERHDLIAAAKDSAALGESSVSDTPSTYALIPTSIGDRSCHARYSERRLHIE